jgi:aspartate-semialdehyde dehydrogenase
MHVAVLGATGAVGRTVLGVLESRGVAVERLTPLASSRSAGTRLPWAGSEIPVAEVSADAFRGVDIAIFSAGAERSLHWAPIAAEAGATVVDNSSAWRMEPDVPLVVPEVNADTLAHRPRGIIANPNCSTIQLVVALGALRDLGGVRRVNVTTFQAVSGAGESGRAALRAELREGEGEAERSPFPARIAGNVIPLIGDVDASGWTGEERKMMSETRKILGLPDLAMAATCVRVPVDTGHAVQAAVEFDRPVEQGAAMEALRRAPGVRLFDDPGSVPMPRIAAGQDRVYVGRVRSDPDLPEVLHLWIVADNLRKGAATNAVQIVERLADG